MYEILNWKAFKQLKWPSRSFTVIRNDVFWQNAFSFLLVFHFTYVSILCRFWDTALVCAWSDVLRRNKWPFKRCSSRSVTSVPILVFLGLSVPDITILFHIQKIISANQYLRKKYSNTKHGVLLHMEIVDYGTSVTQMAKWQQSSLCKCCWSADLSVSKIWTANAYMSYIIIGSNLGLSSLVFVVLFYICMFFYVKA